MKDIYCYKLASKFKILVPFLFSLFFLSEIKAQVCTGTLGDPIAGAGTDFGAGVSAVGGPLPSSVTSYNFVAGNPNDGQYTIVKSTNGLNPGWHQTITNHTSNDPNGYMMVVNADYNKGIFYQTTVNGLCPNTTYEFAAWIINILINPGIRPNIKFTIENDGVPIATFATGDIVEGSATDWKKYGTTFITPLNLGTITLKMTNENPGGGGNDLALDDITFRACGPIINTAVANDPTSATTNICAGKTLDIPLDANIVGGNGNLAYQWQINTITGWQNINGETSTHYVAKFVNAISGTYLYRLIVGQQGSMASSNCTTLSKVLAINVVDKPAPVITKIGTGCVGTDIQFSLGGTGVTDIADFSWTGPNNFTSTDRSPKLTNITTAMAGSYTVSVTTASGCTDSRSIQLNVYDQPVAKIATPSQTTICQSTSVQLNASGGTAYNWSPTTGLSNPYIANPIASPSQTTNYTVSVSTGNGACTSSASILITVNKSTIADAGTDKKILAGQSVKLNEKATPTNVTYLWSPATYLDDPTSASPIANPPSDITYTLTVTSGCNTSTDEVMVKVFSKIEIPNTFTPNGDGVNDTWSIPAAEAFAEPRLKIFNRSGQIIYQSSGLLKPWDGKFNGKELPVAAYYYTLYLSEDFKPFTGWVFLTR